MEFKYSMSILFSHTGYIFKMMVWILICLVITLGIGAAFFVPLTQQLIKTTDISTVILPLKDSIGSVWDGSMSLRAAVNVFVPEVTNVFKETLTNPGVAAGFIIGAIVVYAVYCFLLGLSFYALADNINKLMASNLRFGLASSMAFNFGKCCKFSAAKLGISLPLDILFSAAMIAMAFSLFKAIDFFAAPLLIVVFIVFITLRAVIFGGWLPRMLNHPEEKAYVCFSRSLTFVKHNAGSLFKAFAMVFICCYLVMSVLLLPTGGLILILLPSIYYFILRAIELVGYYKTHGFSFYTDAVTVVNTVDFGLRRSNQNKDID